MCRCLYWSLWSDCWLRSLIDLRQYIQTQRNNELRFTPFTRIKFFWLKAANAALNERSLVKLIRSADGQSFEYSRPGLPPVKIELAILRKLVHSNLGELRRRFSRLLPSTFPVSQVDRLPWGDLWDDVSSSQSFIDAPIIWEAWLKEAIGDLKYAYLNPLETDHSLVGNSSQPLRHALDKLIHLDQQFQESLIVDELIHTPAAEPHFSHLFRRSHITLRRHPTRPTHSRLAPTNPDNCSDIAPSDIASNLVGPVGMTLGDAHGFICASHQSYPHWILVTFLTLSRFSDMTHIYTTFASPIFLLPFVPFVSDMTVVHIVESGPPPKRFRLLYINPPLLYRNKQAIRLPSSPLIV